MPQRAKNRSEVSPIKGHTSAATRARAHLAFQSGTLTKTLCEDCAGCDHLFHMPTHLVHPATLQRHLWDSRGQAFCLTCRCVWQATTSNRFTIIDQLEG